MSHNYLVSTQLHFLVVLLLGCDNYFYFSCYQSVPPFSIANGSEKKAIYPVLENMLPAMSKLKLDNRIKNTVVAKCQEMKAFQPMEVLPTNGRINFH